MLSRLYNKKDYISRTFLLGDSLYCKQEILTVPKISQEWAKCVKRILDRYDLNYREARNKGEQLYSHTTVREWAVEGVIPTYNSDLPKFLEMISSREEAVDCLEAAGLPLPSEWRSGPMTPHDVEVHFRNAFGLSAEEMAGVMEAVEEIKRKRDAEIDGQGGDG